MGEKRYSVYIVASKLRVLYTGITSNLVSRVWQHKTKRVPGFSGNYNCNQLVYYETFRNVGAAIAREKQIKGWRRSKKLNLVETTNPKWKDLSADWYPTAWMSKTTTNPESK
jgi:putative endonuclease